MLEDPDDIIVCDGLQTGAVLFFSNVDGITYTWTNDTPSIGLAATGTGAIGSFAAINTTNAPITATIIVTPSTSDCGEGIIQEFTITVNPTPTVNDVDNQELCDGQDTDVVSFTSNVDGTTYEWINDEPSIGLAATGTGDIPSFTAINTTNIPIIANIIITPTANDCVTGVPQSFAIIVNPTPVLEVVDNQIVCHDSFTTDINFIGLKCS